MASPSVSRSSKFRLHVTRFFPGKNTQVSPEWTNTMATSGMVMPETEEELTSAAGAQEADTWLSSEAEATESPVANWWSSMSRLPGSCPRGTAVPEITAMEAELGVVPPPDRREAAATGVPPGQSWRYNTPSLALCMRGTRNSPSLSSPSYSSKSSSDFLMGSLWRFEVIEWWDGLSALDPWLLPVRGKKRAHFSEHIGWFFFTCKKTFRPIYPCYQG